MRLSEQQLLAELAKLPKSVEPPADLWSEIQPRLSDREVVERSPTMPAPRRAPWVAVAAVLVALVSGTMGYILGQAGQVQAGTADLAYTTSPGAALIHAQGLEQEYLGVWREINAAQLLPASILSGETRADFKRNMELFETATTEIREALAQDPDSMYLAELLETTYQQQLSFMKNLLLQANAATPLLSDTEIQDRSLL